MQCPTCGSEVPSGSKFCGQCGLKLGDAPAAPVKVETPATERREVAVLFADVSGFTALSEKLDPEDVHELMNRCFAGIGAAIQEEGGYIDKYIGDNVMALFGAPTAHEDDPARACRAALSIHEFLRSFSEECERESGVKLQMRIGLNYGLVLAGGVGSDVKMDYTVMGDTVNLASRLETAATPGTVLVSEQIYRNSSTEFEFGPPIELKVKGKESLVRAYQLLREALSPALAHPAAAPLIGREAELAELRRRFSADQHRRWIEVRGDMGTGKTRLVRETFPALPEKRLIQIVATVAICRRPFGLVRRLVYVTFKELLGEPIETRDRFVAALQKLSGGLSNYEIALWYLVAPSRLAVSPPAEDPLSFRRTIERGVLFFLSALAARYPEATLFFDSYEHVDEASATMLHTREEGEWPLPIVTATREGAGRDPLDASSAVELTPLSDAAAGELLSELMHRAEAPEALRRNVLRRAGGVPLFLEEIVRALIEAGELVASEAGEWFFKPSLQAMKLPSSLRSAMVTRLDRLPPAERELLGHCSVQGVEFNIAAAERVRQSRGRGETALVLDNLVRQGIIRLGGPIAVFVQPLMQEACYQMLLRRERRDLHDATARALCELAGGEENIGPEMLVFHYENSEQWEKAAEANLRAANRAADLFLNEEAIAGYDRVLFNLEKAGSTSGHSSRLAVLAHCGAAEVHIRIGAYAAAEERTRLLAPLAANDAEHAQGLRLLAVIFARTGRADEAQKLLGKVVSTDGSVDFFNQDLLSFAWYGLAELHHRAGRLDEAIYSLRCCRATAVAARSRTTLRADLLEGLIAHTRGQFTAAAEYYKRAFELAGELGSMVERARAINNLGNVARDEGAYEAARSHYEEALRLWTRIGDIECIAGGHNNLGNLALSSGIFSVARGHYEESLAACCKIGNVNGAALAYANLGVLALDENDGPRAIAAARASLSTLSGSANDLLSGLVQAVLGDGHLLAGETAEAGRCFERVLAEFSESTHPLAVATAVRGMGRVAMKRGDFANARELFERAIGGFQRLNRSQEEVRTVLEHARLCLNAGDHEGARRHAAAAFERFTAINAHRDAARARELVVEAELRACSAGANSKN